MRNNRRDFLFIYDDIVLRRFVEKHSGIHIHEFFIFVQIGIFSSQTPLGACAELRKIFHYTPFSVLFKINGNRV